MFSLVDRRSWATVWMALAPLLFPACSGGPAQPAQPPVAAPKVPAESAAIGASPQCESAKPQSDNACLRAICENGQWALQPVGPRVVCELSPAHAERQALTEPTLKGDPGVCYEGQCLPRLLCVELCGRALGEQLGPALYAEVQACRQRDPTRERSECAREVQQTHQRVATEFGQRVIACQDQCGFPARVAARTLRPPAIPDPPAEDPME